MLAVRLLSRKASCPKAIAWYAYSLCWEFYLFVLELLCPPNYRRTFYGCLRRDPKTYY